MMDSGNAFLKSQIDNAIVQHRTFLSALEAHEVEADDSRLSDLCSRHIPHMHEHQRMLEEYQSQLGRLVWRLEELRFGRPSP